MLMTMRSSVILFLTSLAGAVVCAAGCSKSPTGPSEDRTIGDFLTGATIAGTTQPSAASRAGTPPAPAGGPTATVSSSSQASGGGPGLVEITGSAPFQTIYISVGAAQTAMNTTTGPIYAWLESALFPRLAAASISTSGYLQIDLPAPVTTASVVVNFASGLPARDFDLQVQLAASGGAAGPVASAHKSNTGPGNIEIVGIVYGGKRINPTGPDSYVNPIAGAIISTSLDSRTAVTGSNGAFDLLTDTVNAPGRCFRVTVTAAGRPPFTTDGWLGSNKESGGITFSLDTAEPRSPLNGTGC